MQRILLDALACNAVKRSGMLKRVNLDDGLSTVESHAGELLEIDPALKRLAVMDPRHSRVVVLRFFGGLTALARAWLGDHLRK